MKTCSWELVAKTTVLSNLHYSIRKENLRPKDKLLECFKTSCSLSPPQRPHGSPLAVGFGLRSKTQQRRASWLGVGVGEETAAKTHVAQLVIHNHSLDFSSWGVQSPLLV